jgi:thiamine-monophosphate kinase
MAPGEFDLIARLVERLPPPSDAVRVPSGDDAAVAEGGAATVTTVDSIVEGVHFTLPAYPLAAVGRKALAASLSDLAAMGALPGEAYVALGVPEGMGTNELVELADGLAEVAERERVAVVGGDVTRAPALSLAVTCVGREPDGSSVVTRSGAREGDAIVVTGELGGAAAALELIGRGERDNPIAARQLDPRPRIEAGLALAAAGASAMIDVSDGLGADAGHLARASAVRVEIDLERIPVAEGASLEQALGGGEDFELLAAVPRDGLGEAIAAVEASGVGLTEIGAVAGGEPGAFDQAGNGLGDRGFDHIRGSRSG